MINPTTYQVPGQHRIDRKDHVWLRHGAHWKCCLCGAVSLREPPAYPTPDCWLPDHYEGLTADERRMAVGHLAY